MTRRQREPSALVEAGARISRDTLLYAAGQSAVFPLSLISVAVTTRFLTPGAYGHLGVLFVFAGLLTTIYNLGTLHGTFMYVYGMGEGGEDGDIGDVAIEDGPSPVRASNHRRAAGTGYVLTFLIVGFGSAVLMVLAGPLSHLLSSGRVGWFRWAAASAALGSLWRFNIQLLRMERRSATFAITMVTRPLFALILTVGLLVAGMGVVGAIMGTAGGTLLSLLLAMRLTRRSWVITFNRRDARAIFEFGRRFIGVTVSMWTVHNAELLFLSGFASDRQVGLYRLASRLASAPSYFVSAFLMAWSPLDRTMLFRGLYDEQPASRVRGLMFTYYLAASVAIVAVLGVAADLLVLVAAPSYRAAAPLLPVIGCGVITYGVFLVLARMGRIPQKGRWYNALAISSSLSFCGLSLVLIPWLGAYGAALATILSMSMVSAVFVVVIQRGHEPVQFDYPRILGVFALGAAVYLGGTLGGRAAGRWHIAVGIASLVAYLPALVASGIVPREHVAQLLGVVRELRPNRSRGRALVRRVVDLVPAERHALAAVVRDRKPLSAYAAEADVSAEVAAARVARGLRSIARAGRARPCDHDIGRMLLADVTSLERDGLAETVVAGGVPALELHALESTLHALRAAPRRSWREQAPTAFRSSPRSRAPC